MIRVFLRFFLLGVLVTIPLKMEAHEIGAGFLLGEPSGLSFKYWTTEKTAFDLALAWSLRENNAFHIHIDYLLHNYQILQIEGEKVAVYYGIGGRFKQNGSNRFGARFPLGISYTFRKIAIEIFMEIAPIFDFTPKTELNMNGGIGIRYTF